MNHRLDFRIINQGGLKGFRFKICWLHIAYWKNGVLVVLVMHDMREYNLYRGTCLPVEAKAKESIYGPIGPKWTKMDRNEPKWIDKDRTRPK